MRKQYTTWLEAKQDLVRKAKDRHHGKLMVRAKSEWFLWWKFVHYLLKVITFGQAGDFYHHYTTIWWRTIWLPGDGRSFFEDLESNQYEILSHEIDHLDFLWFDEPDAQDNPDSMYKDKPLWWRLVWLIGYLVWPLPVLIATFRQQVEMHGYRRNMDLLVLSTNGKDSLPEGEYIRNYYTAPFCGATYFWMATKAKASQIYRLLWAWSYERYKTGKLDHLISIERQQ